MGREGAGEEKCGRRNRKREQGAGEEDEGGGEGLLKKGERRGEEGSPI